MTVYGTEPTQPTQPDIPDAGEKPLAQDGMISDEEIESRLTEAIEALRGQETHTDGRFSAWLMRFRDVIAPNGKKVKVLYPGSAAHTDVGDIFGAESVVHVDPDAVSMSSMSRHGYLTETMTMEEYAARNPTEQYGLIVSLNAGLLPKEILALLQPGGYVVVNNWHGSASNLLKNPDFELVEGVIPDYVSPEAELVSADEVRAELEKATKEDNGAIDHALALFQKKLPT